MRHLLILSLLALLLGGCTHIISKESRDRANRAVSFSELQKNPDRFRGTFVMLGGVVSARQEVREGIELEVVAYPLTSEEMPDAVAGAQGRFLVVLPREMASVPFNPGTYVSLAGEVVGGAARREQKDRYRFPVLVAKEIHIIVSPGAAMDGGY